MSVEIFHNPRCSKSRATLALLEERGVQAIVRLYLQDPPTEQELKRILQSLDMQPRELLRRGEAEYKSLGLADPSISDAKIISAMAHHPKLIERPIVTSTKGAAIGRPPESVLEIL